MANRTRQAHKLAYELSAQTNLRVEVAHLGKDEWEVRWPGGPTRLQMRELVERTLVLHEFSDMRDRRLSYTRGESDRAWAARAVAAYREGTLAPAVAERALLHSLPPTHTAMAGGWTPEDYAALDVVEELVENTPFPDRASDPGDEPFIEQLLAVTGGRRRDMARLLLANGLEDAPDTPGDGARPALRIVRDTGEDARG